jgi:rhodanese-related sulfurtransferase
MKYVPRLAAFLVFTTLSLAGLGCGSSTKRDSIVHDAQTAADTAGMDAPGPAPDTAAPLPDAGTRDTMANQPDALVGDTAMLSLDTAIPKPDTATPDLRAADTIAPSIDTTLAKPEVAAPDTTPARADAQAADAAFHCPLDAGPATLGRLSPLELKTLLDGNEDVFLINVKGATIGKIPGTDAVLVNDIPGIEALVGGDLCANIILYCQSGNTSQTVAAQLLAKGYRRIRDLTGGITAWKAAGYPTL